MGFRYVWKELTEDGLLKEPRIRSRNAFTSDEVNNYSANTGENDYKPLICRNITTFRRQYKHACTARFARGSTGERGEFWRVSPSPVGYTPTWGSRVSRR